MSEERKTQAENRPTEIKPSQVLTSGQARFLGLEIEDDVSEVWIYGAKVEIAELPDLSIVKFVSKHLGHVTGTFTIDEIVSVTRAYSEQKHMEANWLDWVIILIGFLTIIVAIFVQTMRHP